MFRGIAAWLVSGLALAGCAPARVHLIPLQFQKINTDGPLMLAFEPAECYWWINDREELCISMTLQKTFLRTPFNREEFHLSFVLEGKPAGAGRTYRVDSRTLRARVRAGASHTRLASLDGVVGIWNFGSDELKGRFQLRAVQQSYLVLMGWTHMRQVLCVGEFEAVHHPAKGEAILARTERDAMARSAPTPESLRSGQPRPVSSTTPARPAGE